MMSMQQGDSRAARLCWRLVARVAVCVVIAMGLLGTHPAAARRGHVVHAKAPVFEWILLDADTGQVLSEHNADVLTYPASLTKMMTLYLTFEALNRGRIRLDQRFRVSRHAASRAPSKLSLRPGDSVSVHNLILAIVTKSANDAASVLAEGLAGSEARFARRMTRKARELGMNHTWYDNASGLPDPKQRTTARDIARLALALYHRFPREYRYFSTQEFDFRGRIVHGHNHLLEWYRGADGIKTGFINASGFNLAASAVRDGHRLIGVIMGGRTAHERDEQMASLLDQGFAVVEAGRPAPRRSEPVIAGVRPAPDRAPAHAPAHTKVVTAAKAAGVARAAAAAKAADAPEHPGLLREVATATLRHLAPVSRAEASPLRRAAARAAAHARRWSIQIGAFRARKAAVRAARRLPALAILKGKPHHILHPTKSGRKRLYRVRLLHFSAKGAEAACKKLHREKRACAVVKPSGMVVASR